MTCRGLKMKWLLSRYEGLSLAGKISLLSIMVISFVMISFTFIIRIFYKRSVVEIVVNDYEEKFEIVSENCMNLFSEAEQISRVICTDEDVQKWFDCDRKEGEAEYIRRLMKAEQQLDYIDALFPKKYFGISIFSVDGDVLSTNNIRSRKAIYHAFFSELAGQTASIKWLDLYSMDIDGYEGGIAFVRPYKDYATGKVRGYIMVEYNTHILADNFSELRYGEKGQYVIVDREGNVKLSSGEKEVRNIRQENFFQYAGKMMGKNICLYQGEKFLVTVSDIKTLNWIMIGLTPLDVLTKEADIIIRLVYIIGFFAMLISAFFNRYITHNVTRPLSTLAETMERFGKGELTVCVPIEYNDEVGRLSDNFNKMTVQIGQLIEQVYEEQRMKRKYEISVLQAQINPHFLYNTLNSVCSLIKVGKPDEAYVMICAIGQFYRTALSNGNILIPIEEEIENVNNYIKIQTIRYGEKIAYDIETEDEIGKYYIVKLTLQPIVENAIYHGVKEMSEKGFIRIRGYRKEDRIIFEIKDNGVGMEQEKVDALMKTDGNHEQTSFGLYSIHQRIQLYFGKEYGLQLFSSRGKGVTALISLPCVKEGAMDEWKN